MSDSPRSGRWDILVPHCNDPEGGSSTNGDQDPVPWGYGSQILLKNRYSTLADACGDAAVDLRSVKAGEIGEGDVADALQELVGKLPGLLEDAKETFQGAADAFEAWGEALSTARQASYSILSEAQTAYEALDDPDDWDDDREPYVDRLNAVLETMSGDVDTAVNALDELMRNGWDKAWDLWNQVVEWTEENPLIYAALMVVAGIAVIFIPVAGLGIALGILGLLVSVTSLHRQDKLGLNLHSGAVILTEALGVIPGAAFVKAGGAMGRAGSFLTANRGPISGGLHNAANSIRNSPVGTSVSSALNRGSDIRQSVTNGTFNNSPKQSLYMDVGASSLREGALSTAAGATVEYADKGEVDWGNAIAGGIATGAPGGAVGAAHSHGGFQAAFQNDGSALLGSDAVNSNSLGANDASPEATNVDPADGSVGGVDSSFPSDGPSTVEGTDGTTTTIEPVASGDSGSSNASGGDVGGGTVDAPDFSASGDSGATTPAAPPQESVSPVGGGGESSPDATGASDSVTPTEPTGTDPSGTGNTEPSPSAEPSSATEPTATPEPAATEPASSSEPTDASGRESAEPADQGRPEPAGDEARPDPDSGDRAATGSEPADTDTGSESVGSQNSEGTTPDSQGSDRQDSEGTAPDTQGSEQPAGDCSSEDPASSDASGQGRNDQNEPAEAGTRTRPTQSLSTDTGSGANATSRLDADGNMVDATLTAGDVDRGNGFEVTNDGNSSRVVTPDGPPSRNPFSGDRGEVSTTTTEVTSDGTTSRGEFGEIGFNRSNPDSPVAEYRTDGFAAEMPHQGQANIENPGDGGDPRVRADRETMEVTNDAGQVSFHREGDGGFDLTHSDGSRGPSYDANEGSLTHTTGDGGTVEARRTPEGAELRADDVRVDQPVSDGSSTPPTRVRPNGDGDTTVTSRDGDSANLSNGDGPTTVRDATNQRTTEIRTDGTTTRSFEGTQHTTRPRDGQVEAVSATGGSGRAGNGEVEVANSSPDNPTSFRADGEGSVEGRANGSSAVSDGQGTTVTHESSGSQVTRDGEGRVTAGDSQVSPDGSVDHPDFTRHPDGSLDIPDGEGGTWSYGPDGAPLESASALAVPALPPSPRTGAPTHTAPDGTRVSPGNRGEVRTPDGWNVTPTGNGGSSIGSPPDASGNRLTVTHEGGTTTMGSGGDHVSSHGDGSASGRTGDGVEAQSSREGSSVSDQNLISTVDGHNNSRTTDAGDGSVVADHNGNGGSAPFSDGSTVSHKPSGGEVRVHDGGTADLTTGNGNRVRVGDGSSAVSGAPDSPNGGPSWSAQARDDGAFGLGSDRGSLAAVDADGNTNARVQGEGAELNLRTSPSETVVTDSTTNTQFSPYRDGARVENRDSGAGIDLRESGSVVRPGGNTGSQRVTFDQGGAAESIQVNQHTGGQPVHHADGTVTVGPEGGDGARVRPDGADVEWNGSNLSVRDGETTVQNSSDPGNNVVHGGGSGDGVLNMTQDGNQHSFDADGPRNQTGGDPDATGTHPSLSREGNTSTVEQVYRPQGSTDTVDAPTMSRDSANNRSEVSHDGFRAGRSDDGTKVELNDQGVAVTRNNDGGTVVETDSFRVERSPNGETSRGADGQDNGKRDLTIRPDGDSGIEVTRDIDGTVRVKEDGETVHEQRGDGRSGDGGNRDHPVGDGQWFRSGDVEVRVGGDGRIQVNRGSEQVDVNRNGVPFTTLKPGPGEPTTTIKEGAKGDVDIRTTPGPDGPRGRQDTRIGQDGSVESVVVKPKGESENGVAESWGMGIDANGQVSTNNNRLPAEGPIRLSENGNLREVTDQREATMSSTERTPDRIDQLWADWREARRTGDNQAMENFIENREILLREIGSEIALEMKKSAFNVMGGVALQAIKSAVDDDENLLQDGQIENGIAQILTAAPKSVAEQAYVGTDFLPESGPGQIPWRYAGELGHQAMRDNFDDSASDFWKDDGFLEEAEEEED